MKSVVAAFVAIRIYSIRYEDHQRYFMRPVSMFFDRLARRTLNEEDHQSLLSMAPCFLLCVR